MPVAAPAFSDGRASAASIRMKTLLAPRPVGARTRPASTPLTAPAGLKFGSPGSAHESVLGTLVPAPGRRLRSSGQAGPPPLVREAAAAAGSRPVFLSVGFGSVVLHPARASTAAISPAPPRRMGSPPNPAGPPRDRRGFPLAPGTTRPAGGTGRRGGRANVAGRRHCSATPAHRQGHPAVCTRRRDSPRPRPHPDADGGQNRRGRRKWRKLSFRSGRGLARPDGGVAGSTSGLVAEPPRPDL